MSTRSRTTSGASSRVEEGPDGALVLLVGISPVYAHGLCAALEGSGMHGRTVSHPGALAAALDETASRVAVVPQALSAEVAALVGATRSPRPRLVVLVSPDAAALDTTPYRDALRAGTVSLVPADAALPEVVAVLSGAWRGYTCMPPGVVVALCSSLEQAQVPDLEVQERSWLQKIADGATVAQLAVDATYSEREMYRRLRSLYGRLGAGNRREALFAAQRSGLLTA